MRFHHLAAALAAALAGCTSVPPDEVQVSWSEQRSSIRPTARVEGESLLLLRTDRLTTVSDVEFDHRGYAIYDERGRLVRRSDGYVQSRGWSGRHTDATELVLEPGRYIVVAPEEAGLGMSLRVAQVVIEPGSRSYVDMSRHATPLD